MDVFLWARLPCAQFDHPRSRQAFSVIIARRFKTRYLLLKSSGVVQINRQINFAHSKSLIHNVFRQFDSNFAGVSTEVLELVISTLYHVSTLSENVQSAVRCAVRYSRGSLPMLLQVRYGLFRSKLFLLFGFARLGSATTTTTSTTATTALLILLLLLPVLPLLLLLSLQLLIVLRYYHYCYEHYYYY